MFLFFALSLVWPCAIMAQTSGVDLGGSIKTRTDVQTFVDLSQDIGEIRNLVAQNQPEEAFRIYREGQHSEIQAGVKRSLKSLADEMVGADPKTPSFLYHLYGQADRTLNLAFDTQKLGYIDSVIEEIFTTKPELAVEAIWIMNVWMYATHVLYNGVYECQKRSQSDNPQLVDIGMAGFDKFIALWIGGGQQPGASNGDSLYAWSQLQGEAFGTNDPESQVNTRIKLLYSEAITLMSTEDACTRENPNTAGRLWQLVVNTVSEMSKPLFQGMIGAINGRQEDLVNLYAKALVPQTAKCRPSLYKRMHESLILGTFINDPTVIANLPIDDIPDLTFCFGYSCQDLGNTQIGACEDFDVFRPTLAGYVPLTEVGNVAAADLDVYQLKILTSLNANFFADMLYNHGANIAKYRKDGSNDPLEYVSIHDIAVSSERSSAQPFFDIYVSYNNEKDYGDKVIQEALAGTSKWVASQQIAGIIGTTAAYQILFLEAVTKLKIAVQGCREADPTIGVNLVLNPIDEAAALLIGSMEGAKLGGSPDLEDGQLIYNMANRHAFQFNTINKSQYANSVSIIEDLLFAARGELDGLVCDNLERTTEAILRYAMVGVTQACIQLAIENDDLGDFSTAAGIAQAEGLALAILPLISQADASLAGNIAENLVRTPGEEVVEDGGVAVAKMLGHGFTAAFLLQCDKNLGSIQLVDPCENVDCNGGCTDASGGSSNRLTDPTSAKWFGAAVALVLVVVAFFILSRNKHFVSDMNVRLAERGNQILSEEPTLPKYPPRNPPPRVKRNSNANVV